MNFKLRKISGNKRGLLGGFIGMFVATIAVVIILLVFVLVSGITKTLSGNNDGVAIKDAEGTAVDRWYFMGLFNLDVKNRVYFHEASTVLSDTTREIVTEDG